MTQNGVRTRELVLLTLTVYWLTVPAAVCGSETGPGVEQLVSAALTAEFSRLSRLPLTLFPDTRNPELIKIKTGFETNYFLRPRIVRTTVHSPELNCVPGPSGPEKIYSFDRIDMELAGNSLVRHLIFSSCTLSFRRPKLRKTDLEQGIFKPVNEVPVTFRVTVPFKQLALFIAVECKRAGAVVPDLELEGKTVKARGRLKVLIFNLDLAARGEIYLDRPDRSVRYRVERVDIGSLRIPPVLYRPLVSEFNPVIRFEPEIFELVPVDLNFRDNQVELLMRGTVGPE